MPRRDERHDSDLPPPSDGPRSAATSPRDVDDRKRRIENVIPDLIKKAVERGYDRATGSADALRSYLIDSKMPKEIVTAILSQIDDTKNGLFRVVAKEVRGFLEAVDFQRELQKLLTTVSFEIKTEIRFIPNDSAHDKLGRPEVKAGMKVKRNDAREGGKKKKAARAPEPESDDEPQDHDDEQGDDDLPGGADID